MKGEKYELEFFSEGFFGYGREGDFKAWSIAHIVPLLVLGLGICLLALNGDALRAWEYEEQLRYGLAMLMMLVEFSFYFRLPYVGPESHERKTMMMRLPLQVCQWTLLISIPTLILRSPLLFHLIFYLTMTCGLIPLVLPAVISTTGPRYMRYYHFWGEHILPIWSMFYLFFVHGLRPSPIGILMEYAMLIIMAFPAFYLNKRFDDCYYLYLKPEKFSMLKRLAFTSSTGRLAVFFAAVIGLLCLLVQIIYQLLMKLF